MTQLTDLIIAYNNLHENASSYIHQEEEVLKQIKTEIEVMYENKEVEIVGTTIEIKGFNMVTRADLEPLKDFTGNYWVDSDLEVSHSYIRPPKFFPLLKLVIEVEEEAGIGGEENG